MSMCVFLYVPYVFYVCSYLFVVAAPGKHKGRPLESYRADPGHTLPHFSSIALHGYRAEYTAPLYRLVLVTRLKKT